MLDFSFKVKYFVTLRGVFQTIENSVSATKELVLGTPFATTMLVEADGSAQTGIRRRQEVKPPWPNLSRKSMGIFWLQRTPFALTRVSGPTLTRIGSVVATTLLSFGKSWTRRWASRPSGSPSSTSSTLLPTTPSSTARAPTTLATAW